nr:hypothetical protein [uncultured Acidocella sp.]
MKAPTPPARTEKTQAAHRARAEAKAAALRANLARRKAQARAKPADDKKDEPTCP